VRESRTPGSVRGDRGNPVPYRVRVEGRKAGATVSSAATIRRQVVAPVVIAGKRELVSSSGAFLERLLAVAFEHQLRWPAKCRSRVSRRESCTVVVDKGLS
jgi:hypothetical protein